MNNSDINYFDHDADIGVIGHGKSLTAAFIDAAKNMFAIMADLDMITSQETVALEFQETDEELALVKWLNHLLTEARIKRLIFKDFELKREHGRWLGKAHGQAWPENLDLGTEVKGATLTGLSVAKHFGEWEVRCVVDV